MNSNQKRLYPFDSPTATSMLASVIEEPYFTASDVPLYKKMSLASSNINNTPNTALSSFKMPNTKIVTRPASPVSLLDVNSAYNNQSLDTFKKPPVSPGIRGRRQMKNLQLVVPPVRSSISAPSSPQLPQQTKQAAHGHNRRPSTPICIYQNKTGESHSNPSADPMVLISRTENAIAEELPYKDEPICILPHFYLGSELNAANREMLNRLNVEYILNVAMEVPNPYMMDIINNQKNSQYLQCQSISPGLSSSSSISSDSSYRTAVTSPIAPAIHASSPLPSDASCNRSNSLIKQSPSRPSSLSANLQSPDGPMGSGVPLTVPATDEFKAMKYKKYFWTHNQDNLISDFEHAFAYIDEARSAGRNILVHCQCGVSRSASLVIAYVMKTNRMTLNQAYEFVKDRSPYISPNMSLVYQLVDFEKTLKLNNTAAPQPSESRKSHSRNSSIESDLLLKGHRRSNSLSRPNSIIVDSPPRTPLIISSESLQPFSPNVGQQTTIKGDSGRFHVITATSLSTPTTPSPATPSPVTPSTASTLSPSTPSTGRSRRSSRPPPLSNKQSSSSLSAKSPNRTATTPLSPSFPQNSTPMVMDFPQFGQDPMFGFSYQNGDVSNVTGVMVGGNVAAEMFSKQTLDSIFSPTRASPPVTVTKFSDLWSDDE
ncbi:5527_t:CDS:1 [Paraglomus occultum]|uniref:protein-tyrosine-phosphatase n=1 Tax=Paraglomus occultum TaxID=144539 RepID=A0A9N9BP88_9GLOM|nr:5527_t:CDS:1 [Paraglomus occultum]